ncbi:tetratricopeptide repeat protein [Alteraurantiacibacter aquimixticola]|uniref:Tetratricopeptide repeat protein n=1 Tax=Alteraurantiacibacter aquimixticola TaxID=2489173 RepID=A0A4T3F4R8_9SPHN|nr:tetratricopeptide repeat protein [Alteraurantiacibacter aquimixticola]TIX49703.1 tetratricopeptide repeat protein [Alteraurantiacibacter aquimixticola]
MLDFLSPQFWILAALAIFGWAHAHYVWMHIAHDPSRREITAPPEDLSWRSDNLFYRSLAILAGVVSLAVFIFTPHASEFAQSDFFVPALLGLVGSAAVGRALADWRSGTTEPLIRGVSATYNKASQPLKYWASLAWNASVGIAFLATSLFVFDDHTRQRCDDDVGEQALSEMLETCSLMLAENNLDQDGRAELLAARGRVNHRLQESMSALDDYSAALELEPQDSYTLYNRALIHSRLGNLPSAIDDLNASLAINPDFDDAYIERGNAFLDTGQFEKAIGDFTTLFERDPDHPYALANRGIAHAWMGNADVAEKDFSRVAKDSPGWIVVLRGRAILATNRDDDESAIEFLNDALAIQSDDTFSLHMRAEIYWENGQRDLAARDDDLIMEIEKPRLVRVTESP